ncbi:unnamed protein product, partial [Polarella glacialis]
MMEGATAIGSVPGYSIPGKGSSCELVLRLPAVSDVSLSANGCEAAFATCYGAIVCELEHHPEPPHVRWCRAAGPEIGPSVARLAFSKHASTRRHLAVASGRSVC